MTANEAIFALLAKRSPGKTICPSEAARLIDPVEWRGQMETVRSAAARLADKGRLVVTQRGRAVDPRSAKGPVRLRLP